MSTVLSPLTASNFNNALLVSGQHSQSGSRIAARAALIESDYGVKINGVDRQAQKWRDFQAELEKPRGVVSGTIGRLKSMRGLIDSAAGQEHQIAMLWQAIEKLSTADKGDCVPGDAALKECFEAEKLNQLVGK